MRGLQWLSALSALAIVRSQSVPSISAGNGVITASANDLQLLQPSGSSVSLSTLANSVSSTASLLASTIADNAADDTRESTIVAAVSAQISNEVSSATANYAMFSTVASAISAAASSAQTSTSTLSTNVAATTGALSSQISAAVAASTTQFSTMTAQVSTLQAQVSTLTAPPSAPSGYPQSCRDLLERFNASAPSGVYTVQPPGVSPFPVYCENDFYGGGWTMVTKINAGPFNQNTNPQLDQNSFYQMAANPAQDVNRPLMLSGEDFPYPPAPMGPFYVASYNRANTNALAAYTMSRGQAPVFRVDFRRNDGNLGTTGTYMQSLAAPPANFDWWGSIRDARLWSNFTGGYTVVGFGQTFFLAKNPPSFNADRNAFIHDSCGDPTFGYWDAQDITVAGQTVSVSRHGGMLGDGHCNQGNQWLLTLKSTDGRFMNDNIRQSNIFIR